MRWTENPEIPDRDGVDPQIALMMELVDIYDLESYAQAWEFESLRGHNMGIDKSNQSEYID